MSKMQTLADIARVLPFAHHSKREGFDWWRPETAESYSENWERGQDYALRLLEAEGPRGGSVSSLGAILLDMVAKADLKTQRGLSYVRLASVAMLADRKDAVGVMNEDEAATLAEASLTLLRISKRSLIFARRRPCTLPTHGTRRIRARLSRVATLTAERH